MLLYSEMRAPESGLTSKIEAKFPTFWSPAYNIGKRRAKYLSEFYEFSQDQTPEIFSLGLRCTGWASAGLMVKMASA